MDDTGHIDQRKRDLVASGGTIQVFSSRAFEAKVASFFDPNEDG
jgi:hypothetical protein